MTGNSIGGNANLVFISEKITPFSLHINSKPFKVSLSTKQEHATSRTLHLNNKSVLRSWVCEYVVSMWICCRCSLKKLRNVLNVWRKIILSDFTSKQDQWSHPVQQCILHSVVASHWYKLTPQSVLEHLVTGLQTNIVDCCRQWTDPQGRRRTVEAKEKNNRNRYVACLIRIWGLWFVVCCRLSLWCCLLCIAILHLFKNWKMNKFKNIAFIWEHAACHRNFFRLTSYLTKNDPTQRIYVPLILSISNCTWLETEIDRECAQHNFVKQTISLSAELSVLLVQMKTWRLEVTLFIL